VDSAMSFLTESISTTDIKLTPELEIKAFLPSGEITISKGSG